MILGFKKRFVPLVKDRSKTHTVRDDAGDRWQAGKKAHPYRNVRQKGMAKILPPSTVRRVEQLIIEADGSPTGMILRIAGVELSPTEADAFAWADGFRWKPNGDPYIGEGEYSQAREGCFDLMMLYWRNKDKKKQKFPYRGKVIHF